MKLFILFFCDDYTTMQFQTHEEEGVNASIIFIGGLLPTGKGTETRGISLSAFVICSHMMVHRLRGASDSFLSSWSALFDAEVSVDEYSVSESKVDEVEARPFE